MGEALRCRAVGRWPLQQASEQKTSLTLPMLQLVTLHLVYRAPSAMGVRHVEQDANGAGSSAISSGDRLARWGRGSQGHRRQAL